MKVSPLLIDSLENLQGYIVPDGIVAKVSGQQNYKIGDGITSFKELPWCSPFIERELTAEDDIDTLIPGVYHLGVNITPKGILPPLGSTAENALIIVYGTSPNDTVEKQMGLSTTRCYYRDFFKGEPGLGSVSFGPPFPAVSDPHTVGQGQLVTGAAGANSITLPAGGIGAYHIFTIITGVGTVYSQRAGVLAGGTVITETGNSSPTTLTGFAGRLI